MPHIFKTLVDPEVDIDLFSDGIADPVLQASAIGSLHAGAIPPDWCRLAIDQHGRVLARHRWWGPTDAARPMGVDLLTVEEHGPAVELLADARDRLAVNEAWCEITAAIDEGNGASEARADFVAVLNNSGFRFEVARVKVQWRSGTHPFADSGRLTFRAACDLDDDFLITLFRAVADGSLDHGMTVDRDELGAEREALSRLERARGCRGEAEWFSVAFDDRGEPVGYVVPCLIENDVAVIAEIGVAADHRGVGYVNGLLAHATRQLTAHGATRIVADTDVANTPMRAAFAAAGYVEDRWRDDYRWRRVTPT